MGVITDVAMLYNIEAVVVIKEKWPKNGNLRNLTCTLCLKCIAPEQNIETIFLSINHY